MCGIVLKSRGQAIGAFLCVVSLHGLEGSMNAGSTKDAENLHVPGYQRVTRK